MIIKRDIQQQLKKFASTYPVVTITGPRQAGKTTLARMQFPDYRYCNLENPEIRHYASNDPNAFLDEFKYPVILDEIQRVPQLLSYIQAIVDEKDKKGMYILTGSHQFDLNQAITQSLAGRTALIHLLPFSIHELNAAGIDLNRDEYIFNGFLPRIYKDNLDPSRAYSNYFKTYVERDLRRLINLRDLSAFEIFMKLLAGRTGQVLNLNSLSNDTGVSGTTLKGWLSILEASYIVFRLYPYFENFGKRVIKSPKIYFTEIGLVTYLLDIEELQYVKRDPLLGSLFENLVVLEAIKSRLNKGLDHNLYFFRDNNNNEVDLIFKKSGRLIPIEIKSSETLNSNFYKGLLYFKNLSPRVKTGYLVYGGKLSPGSDFVKVRHFSKTFEIFK